MEQGNSAVIVTVKGTNILVDCGHSVFPTLVKKDLLKDIDAVLVTHFHDDHVGSLSSLILFHDLILQKGPLKIIVPNSTFQSQIEDFLSFSLGRKHGRVDFRPLYEYPFIAVIDTRDLHVQGMQTWAYVFIDDSESIAFSGDLGQPAPFFETLRALDLPGLRVFHEATFFPGIGAHTYYKELEAYLDEFDIYAYHCWLPKRPADLKLKLVADHPELLA